MLEALTTEEIAERVREAIEGMPMSKASVAEAAGVSPQAITGWMSTGRIGKTSIATLARLSGKPIEYFMYRDWERATSGRVVEPTWDDIRGYAQAVGLGDGAEAEEYAETHKLKFRSDSLSRKHLSAPDLAVMYGRGDSMLPRIHSGDAILFDMSDTRPDDEKLFVIIAHGVARSEYNVKRCRAFGDNVYFEALNPAGDHNWRKPRAMNDRKNPIEIIGRVRWIGSWED